MSGLKASRAAWTSSTLRFETCAVPTSTTPSETRSIMADAHPQGFDPRPSGGPCLQRGASARLLHVDRAVANELEDDLEVLGRLLVDREHEGHYLPHPDPIDD